MGQKTHPIGFRIGVKSNNVINAYNTIDLHGINRRWSVPNTRKSLYYKEYIQRDIQIKQIIHDLWEEDGFIINKCIINRTSTYTGIYVDARELDNLRVHTIKPLNETPRIDNLNEEFTSEDKPIVEIQNLISRYIEENIPVFIQFVQLKSTYSLFDQGSNTQNDFSSIESHEEGHNESNESEKIARIDTINPRFDDITMSWSANDKIEEILDMDFEKSKDGYKKTVPVAFIKPTDNTLDVEESPFKDKNVLRVGKQSQPTENKDLFHALTMLFIDKIPCCNLIAKLISISMSSGGNRRERETRRNILKYINLLEQSVSSSTKPEQKTNLYAINKSTNLDGKDQEINTKFKPIKGYLIIFKGRIGGSERSRIIRYRSGSLPRHTVSAPIDYGFSEINTISGKVSITILCNMEV